MPGTTVGPGDLHPVGQSRAPRAALGDALVLPVIAAPARVLCAQRGPELLAQLRRGQGDRLLAGQLIARIAGEGAEGVVDGFEAPLLIEHTDADRGGFDQGADVGSR